MMQRRSPRVHCAMSKLAPRLRLETLVRMLRRILSAQRQMPQRTPYRLILTAWRLILWILHYFPLTRRQLLLPVPRPTCP